MALEAAFDLGHELGDQERPFGAVLTEGQHSEHADSHRFVRVLGVSPVARVTLGEVVGPVLIDSQTGCHMSVPNPDPHPIDLIDVFPEGRPLYDLWDAELNRMYKLAMKMLGPLDGSHAQDGPEVAKALRESQLRWIALRDAESEALGALRKSLLLERRRPDGGKLSVSHRSGTRGEGDRGRPAVRHLPE